MGDDQWDGDRPVSAHQTAHLWVMYYWPLGKKRPSLYGIYSSREKALEGERAISPVFRVAVERVALNQHAVRSV